MDGERSSWQTEQVGGREGGGRGGSVSGVEKASVYMAGNRGSPAAPGVAWQLWQTWTGAEAQEASAEPDCHRGQQMKALLCGDEEEQRSVEKVKMHKHTQKHTRLCSKIQKCSCKHPLQ